MSVGRQRSNQQQQQSHLLQLISGQSILHSELPLPPNTPQSSGKKITVNDEVTVIPGAPEEVHLLAKATSDEKDVT